MRKREGGGGGGYSGGGGGTYSSGGGGGGGSFVSGDSPYWKEGGNSFHVGMLILETPCGSGERLDKDGKCQDVDACSAVPCLGNSTCKDLPPPAPGNVHGRECTCNTGYAMVDGECQDVDACDSFPCGDSHEMCTDKAAPAANGTDGRMCACMPGYAYDSQNVCQDIDACEAHPCHAAAECTDLPPPADGSAAGRACACHPALTGDGVQDCSCDPGLEFNGTACNDIDACIDNACPDSAMTCTDLAAPAGNDAAGRKCMCPEGMMVDKTDPNRCQEINACDYFPCTNARCFDEPRGANATDGRQCVCNQGFTQQTESVCIEFDACENFPCAPNATCTDIVGGPMTDNGRTCECNQGFVGSGLDCFNIDACDQNVCSGDNEVCVDLPPPAGGDASGRECRCKPSYTRDGSNACVFVDYCNLQPCQAHSTCTPVEDGRVCDVRRRRKNEEEKKEEERGEERGEERED